MILGGPESEPFAKINSSIRETRNIPVFMVPGEEYPNARISSFAEIFCEVGLKGKGERIGVVGPERMPLGVHRLPGKDLREVELVDVTPEYERFREIKSPGKRSRSRMPSPSLKKPFRRWNPWSERAQGRETLLPFSAPTVTTLSDPG